MSVITNLVVYYPLDEASGDALDAHSTRNLTDHNTVGSAAGKVSNARDFEASNSEYFSITDNADFSIGSDISCEIAFWLNLESTSTKCIFGKWGDGNDEYILVYGFNGNYLSWFTKDSGGTQYTLDFSTFGALSTSTWYFVTCGYNATSDELVGSINAGTEYTASGGSGIRDGTNPFQMGNLADFYFMDGLLDEWALRKGSIFTGSERTWIYNAGNGRSYANWVAEAGANKSLPPLLRPLRFVNRRYR